VQSASATAVWQHTGMPLVPIRWALVRDPTSLVAPQALLSTKLDCDPGQILRGFVQRWQLDTTFEPARAHVGLETSRQWNDRSIARTTPALLRLYSIATLIAAHLIRDQRAPVRIAAWYAMERATVSDTLDLVRRWLWSADYFSTSPEKMDPVKIARVLFERVTDVLCYAA
jgi:hypothetical protein